MSLDTQLENYVRFELFALMPLPNYTYCLLADSTPYFPFTALSFRVLSPYIMSLALVTAGYNVLFVMTLVSGQWFCSKKLGNHLTLPAFCDWLAMMETSSNRPAAFYG